MKIKVLLTFVCAAALGFAQNIIGDPQYKLENGADTNNNRFGLVNNLPFLNYNEYTGNASGVFEKIGSPGLTFNIAFGNLHLQNFTISNWNSRDPYYSPFGQNAGIQGLGYLNIKNPHGPSELQNGTFYFEGDQTTLFFRDYFFNDTKGNNNPCGEGTDCQFYHYNLLDENLRRLVREPDADPEHPTVNFTNFRYYLLDPDGTKTTFECVKPEPNASPEAYPYALFVPIEKVFPDGQVWRIDYYPNPATTRIFHFPNNNAENYPSPLAGNLHGARIKSITDGWNRQLRFQYDSGPGWRVSRIEFLRTDQNTAPEVVARFGDEAPHADERYERFLYKYTDAVGQSISAAFRRLDDGSTYGYWGISRLTLPTGGVIEVDWKKAKYWRLFSCPGNCHQLEEISRVSQIRLIQQGTTSYFNYQYCTSPGMVCDDPNAPFPSTGILVSVSGPNLGYYSEEDEYLSQTSYQGGAPNVQIYEEGSNVFRYFQNIDAGYPRQRTTRYKEMLEKESWSWGYTFLWRSDFLPFHLEFLHYSSASSSLRMKVRPVAYTTQTFDLENGQELPMTPLKTVAYGYDWEFVPLAYTPGAGDSGFLGFGPNYQPFPRHNAPDLDPAFYANFLAPSSMIISYGSGGNKDYYREDYQYLNRVATGTSADNQTQYPYQLNLITNIRKTVRHDGVVQLQGETTHQYHQLLPLVTDTKELGGLSSADLDTHYRFTDLGAAKGWVLDHFWVGDLSDEANYSTYQKQYQDGLATEVTYPSNLIPAKTIDLLDFQSRVLKVTDRGLQTEFRYDANGRVVFEGLPNPQVANSYYENPHRMAYPTARQTQSWRGIDPSPSSPSSKFYESILTNGFGNITETQKKIKGSVIATQSTHYNRMGIADSSVNPLGGQSQMEVGLNGFRRAQNDAGLKFTEMNSVYNPESKQTIERTVLSVQENSPQKVVKTIWRDLLGRIVAMGVNVPDGFAYPGNLDLLTDYEGGGHTSIEYAYLAGQNIWLQTFKPYGLNTEIRQEWFDLLGRKVMSQHPEFKSGNGTALYQHYRYDRFGNLIEEWLDSNSSVTANPGSSSIDSYRNTFDAMGRLTKKEVRTAGNGYEDLYTLEYHPTNGLLARSISHQQGISNVESEIAYDSVNRPSETATTVDFMDSPSKNWLWVAVNAENALIPHWDQSPGSTLGGYSNLKIAPLDHVNEPEYQLVISNIANTQSGKVSKTLTRTTIQNLIDQQITDSTIRSQWLNYLTSAPNPEFLDPDHSFMWQVQAVEPANWEVSEPTEWKRLNLRPNLIVDSLERIAITPGAHLVSFRVFNSGLSASPSSEAKLYLSETSDMSTANVLVLADHLPIPQIAIGTGHVHQMQVAIPASVIDPDQDGVPNFLYLIVQADSLNRIAEGGLETDNFRSLFCNWLSGTNPNPNLPDLQVVGMNHQYVFLGGSTYQAWGYWGIRNEANPNVSSGASKARVYLSDANFPSHPSTQTIYPHVPTQNLASQATQIYQLPLYTATTHYQGPQQFFMVETDFDDQVGEGNELNNFNFYELDAVPGSGPDLTVFEASHSGYKIVGGKPIIDNIHFRIKNGGFWSTEVVAHAQLWLSHDQTLIKTGENADLPIGEEILIPLLAGGEISKDLPSSEGLRIQVPIGYQNAGTNYLLVEVDSREEIVEGSANSSNPTYGETNNIRALSFAGFADLDAQYMAVVEIEGVQGIEISIANYGNVPAPSSKTGIYLSRVSSFEPNHSSLLYTFLTPVLPAFNPDEPEQSTYYRFIPTGPETFNLPISAEDVWLFMQCDDDNTLLESNERNNFVGTLLQGTGSPTGTADLIINLERYVYTTTKPTPHNDHNGIDLYLRNQGDEDILSPPSCSASICPPLALEMWVSLDEHLDSGDLLEVSWQLTGDQGYFAANGPTKIFNVVSPTTSSSPNSPPGIPDWISLDGWYAEFLSRVGPNSPYVANPNDPTSQREIFLIFKLDAQNIVAEGPDGEANNLAVTNLCLDASGIRDDCPLFVVNKGPLDKEGLGPVPVNFSTVGLNVYLDPKRSTTEQLYSADLTYLLSNSTGENLYIKNLFYVLADPESDPTHLATDDQLVFSNAFIPAAFAAEGNPNLGGFQLKTQSQIQITQTLALPSGYNANTPFTLKLLANVPYVNKPNEPGDLLSILQYWNLLKGTFLGSVSH